MKSLRIQKENKFSSRKDTKVGIENKIFKMILQRQIKTCIHIVTWCTIITSISKVSAENINILLVEANEMYNNGYYEMMEERVDSIIPDTSVPPDVMVSAYRLKALAYIQLRKFEMAENVIDSILMIDSHYQTKDINEPEIFKQLIEKRKMNRSF